VSPGFEFVGEKLLGLMQTMVSITAGVLLVKLIGRLRKERVANILLIGSVILVAGAFLEVVGLLRGTSDAFRNVAYAQGGYEVYADDVRDLSLTGFTRPKFFTSEPSLLGIGFLVFVNSWLLLSYTRKNLLVAGAMTLVLLALTGSPVLVLSMMASTAIVVYSEKQWIKAMIPIGGALLIGSLGANLLLPELFGKVTSRLSAIFAIDLGHAFALSNLLAPTLASDSFGARIVIPLITLVEVMRSSPLFGVGISGKEVIERYAGLPLQPQEALGNNNVTTLFVYLGLIGAVLFVGIFVGYLRRNTFKLRQFMLLAVLVATLSLSMGGFETSRYWGYVFLLIGVMKKKDEQNNTGYSLHIPSTSQRDHPNKLSKQNGQSFE